MTLHLDELGLPSDVLVWQAVLLTLVSFAVGILGGLVGLALGTMRLPVLLGLGIAPQVAAGINIAVSTASALTGAVRHLREGRVDVRVALAVGVPSMVGGLLGGLSSERAPESLLVLLVGLLVMWQGVELISRGRGLHPEATGTGQNMLKGVSDALAVLSRRRVFAGGVVGLAVGVLGGAVGLILGSVRLPALMRILRLDPRAAAGTNLLIGFAMGSMGWMGHVIGGQVDYPLVVLMGAGAMVGSYIGATLTGRVTVDKLLMTMGVVLSVVGALLLWRAAAV